jgi:hypothetical protein
MRQINIQKIVSSRTQWNLQFWGIKYKTTAQTFITLYTHSSVILHHKQYLPSVHSALVTPQKSFSTREPPSWLSWKASFGNVNKSLFTVSIRSVNSFFKSCNKGAHSSTSAIIRVLFLDQRFPKSPKPSGGSIETPADLNF